ncbi:MAG: hypothetical protein KF684_04175 [Phycisphaeraceae bacterium]|nr:hypothetical protein [Phycisphaeraceae bacterium]
MSQGTHNTGHGDGPRRTSGAPGGSTAVHEAEQRLARDMGELSTSIRHLNRSVEGLSAKLDRIDGTLASHAERIVRLEERPTRKDLEAQGERLDAQGERLTKSEKRIALIAAALIALVSGAGSVANILSLIGGV